MTRCEASVAQRAWGEGVELHLEQLRLEPPFRDAGPHLVEPILTAGLASNKYHLWI